MWEQQNEEVHGKTEGQTGQDSKTKAGWGGGKRLNAMKDDARPSDMFLFHLNWEEFVE